DSFLTSKFDRIQLRNEISLQLKTLNLIQPNDEYEFYESSTDIYTVEDLVGERRQVRLILGEPGVGKTTALLKLAEIYFQDASNDVNNVNLKLPAYFDLSRWSNQEQYLDSWLIKELRTNYRINQDFAEFLLENEQMILFFDGLNEVENTYQSDCVREINKFLDQYLRTDIVVCCRREEYLNINELLTREQTTYFQVQLLQEEQINDYLASQGQTGVDLKERLQDNNLLQDLARTPLMLNIMTQLEIKNLPSTGDLEQRRQQLIDAYVKQIFSRRPNPWLRWLKYNEDQAKHWLKWLAQHMESSTFIIE
ncbi:MAG: NACHT domain-containing protein, partial [Moorea sp. SIO2I5]|nr:NACHT domain-containing protein [Moorena sp. SIO2I5]